MQKRIPQRVKSYHFQSLSAERIVDDWVSTGEKRWVVSDNQFSGPNNDSGTEPAEMLIGNDSYSKFRLHMDVHLGESSTGCRVGIAPSATDSPRILFDIPLSDEGIGGAYLEGGKMLAELDPLAQRQLQRNSPNDLRLELDHEALRLYINGCVALQASVASLNIPGPGKVRPVLLADREVAWGNLRIAAWE